MIEKPEVNEICFPCAGGACWKFKLLYGLAGLPAAETLPDLVSAFMPLAGVDGINCSAIHIVNLAAPGRHMVPDTPVVLEISEFLQDLFHAVQSPCPHLLITRGPHPFNRPGTHCWPWLLYQEKAYLHRLRR